jgi:hypothetical protein
MGETRSRSRSLSLLARAALSGLLLFQAPQAHADDTRSSHDLYLSGRVNEALAAARRELAAADAQQTPELRWQRMMYVAWLEESVGEHREAMKHATGALDLAAKQGDAFKIGRSLCWLGWSATSLGLYPLALEFYEAAIATATDGEDIVRPLVWGLATQERGALLAKMGDLDPGAALIEATTDYARDHEILVGVAEGGAHLARIALLRGDLAEARERAEEAVLASERCGCSPYNTNRARVTLARIALARARTHPKHQGEALEMIQGALAGAEKVSDRRHIAEARLLLSQAVDPDDLQQRQELVSSAAALLHETESELRGTADAQLGALLLEREQDALAAAYLRSGFDLNEELLRKLDNAYILGDLAILDGLSDDSQAALEKWMDAASRAEESGAWPLAAESQERLSEDLQSQGFLSLSLHWTEKALESIERLLEQAQDPERREQLARRKLQLTERRVEIDLDLQHPTPRPAPAH